MPDRFDPAHVAHSIDYVAATITFRDRISGPQFLPILKHAIACARDLELPDYGDLIGAGFQPFEPPPLSNLPPSFNLSVVNTGTAFSSLDDAGRKLKSFQVSRQEVKVDSTVYLRWAGFSEVLAEVVRSVMPSYPGPVAQLRLEYRDRYVHDPVAAEAPPSWEQVLKSGDLLTHDHVARPEPWHFHTGWFERDSSQRRRLVNLNVDAHDEMLGEQPRRRTIYLYSLISVLEPLSGAVEADRILEDFDVLHTRSKELLSSILTPEMRERISLAG